MEHIHKHRTLYESFFRHKNIFLDISMMLMAVVILALLSQLYIPLWPVPITGQTFGIFVIAFWFGSRKGALTTVLYILAGLVGFGVFAKHSSGLAVIIGPTGGYIFGFLVCAFFVGFLIEKGHGRTSKSIMGIMVLGNLIIYAFGLIGLWAHFPGMGLYKILMIGVIPFLIGDAIKIGAAVALFPVLWKGSERIAKSS